MGRKYNRTYTKGEKEKIASRLFPPESISLGELSMEMKILRLVETYLQGINS